MRKVLFIFSLLIITVLITGNYFIYKQVTKAHKKEFKAFIRSKYARKQTIKIWPSELYSNNSRITWLDHNKEILLDGVMYDIISHRNEGVQVALTVVEDTQEKNLMKKYQNQFDSVYSTSSGKKQNSFTKDFLAFKYLPHKNISFLIEESGLNQISDLDCKSIVGFLSFHAPPPDVA